MPTVSTRRPVTAGMKYAVAGSVATRPVPGGTCSPRAHDGLQRRAEVAHLGRRADEGEDLDAEREREGRGDDRRRSRARRLDEDRGHADGQRDLAEQQEAVPDRERQPECTERAEGEAPDEPHRRHDMPAAGEARETAEAHCSGDEQERPAPTLVDPVDRKPRRLGRRIVNERELPEGDRDGADATDDRERQYRLGARQTSAQCGRAASQPGGPDDRRQDDAMNGVAAQSADEEHSAHPGLCERGVERVRGPRQPESEPRDESDRRSPERAVACRRQPNAVGGRQDAEQHAGERVRRASSARRGRRRRRGMRASAARAPSSVERARPIATFCGKNPAYSAACSDMSDAQMTCGGPKMPRTIGSEIHAAVEPARRRT